MTRRDALALVTGSALAQVGAGSDLSPFFAGARGVAVAMDLQSNRLIAAHRLETARQLAVLPGSVLKPLVLTALLDSGKLRPSESHPCTGALRIGRTSFACAHPKIRVPVAIPTAIAYSCNEFVANLANRFAPGELADALSRFGLEHVPRVSGIAANQLQALGEKHVTATVISMAEAYRRLAERATRHPDSAILQGLEEAVEYGTAQKAGVPGMKIAGKTGSAPGSWAWFAGFAPSRDPKLVVAVLVRGNAGGADAAPIAGRIISAWRQGEL